MDFLNNLPPTLRDLAEQAHIKTAKQCVLTPMAHLLADNRTSLEDLIEMKTNAAGLIAHKSTTAWEMLSTPQSLRWQRLTFGCHSLDKCLEGGLITRGITELYGCAGVGKTQLLLQLSLTAQLPQKLGGLNAKTAFICTEDNFPSNRFHQLAEHFQRKFPHYELNYLANVFVQHIRNAEHLRECVCDQLPQLMANQAIGLVIIDSIAGIFREYTDFIQRARDMRRIAHQLKSLTNQYNCVIVCVNQASMASDIVNVPCLGFSWAHLVRVRLCLTKLDKEIIHLNSSYPVRQLSVVYSPETSNNSVEFLITDEGLTDI